MQGGLQFWSRVTAPGQQPLRFLTAGDQGSSVRQRHVKRPCRARIVASSCRIRSSAPSPLPQAAPHAEGYLACVSRALDAFRARTRHPPIADFLQSGCGGPPSLYRPITKFGGVVFGFLDERAAHRPTGVARVFGFVLTASIHLEASAFERGPGLKLFGSRHSSGRVLS
jgi:hypothetical protein